MTFDTVARQWRATTDDDVRVYRGARVVRDAAMSVVVMAIDSDPRVADALASILAQTPAVETIVVNSGAGSLRNLLAVVLDRIILIEAKDRRLPGGTRNLGIAASTAPLVAFLAADCIATPGWVGARLERHESAAAVASALRPAPLASGRIPLSSWATYALLHVTRAPEYPPARAGRYGVSYERALLGGEMPFREDLRIGEDTVLNEMIQPTATIDWAPDVLTLHRYPTTIGAGLRDAMQRGREVFNWAKGRKRALYIALRRAPANWMLARHLAGHTRGKVRRELRLAAPLIMLFAAAYGAGVISAFLRDRRERPL